MARVHPCPARSHVRTPCPLPSHDFCPAPKKCQHFQQSVVPVCGLLPLPPKLVSPSTQVFSPCRDFCPCPKNLSALPQNFPARVRTSAHATKNCKPLHQSVQPVSGLVPGGKKMSAPAIICPRPAKCSSCVSTYPFGQQLVSPCHHIEPCLTKKCTPQALRSLLPGGELVAPRSATSWHIGARAAALSTGQNCPPLVPS